MKFATPLTSYSALPGHLFLFYYYYYYYYYYCYYYLLVLIICYYLPITCLSCSICFGARSQPNTSPYASYFPWLGMEWRYTHGSSLTPACSVNS